MKPKSAASPQPKYELKHRLVGAVIMVTLAALIIPWLLSEREGGGGVEVLDENSFWVGKVLPTITGLVGGSVDEASDEVLAEETGDESGEESGEDTGIVLVKVEPTPQSTTSDSTSSANTSATPSASETSSTSEISSTSETSSTNTSKAQTALPDTGGENEQVKKPPVPATSSSGWVVKAGTYSNQANADSVYAKLENRGFGPKKASVRIALNNGNATQIWLGPYAKRETAEEVSRGIENIIGEKGFVTRHKP